jgi:hypothetical protein
VAYGYTVGKGRKGKKQKAPKDGELRLGFALKALWRRGGYKDITTTQLTGLSSSSVANIMGNYGFGFGGDIGAQYVREVARATEARLGMAWTDIGNTNFAKSNADPIQQNLSIGGAIKWARGITSITGSYDLRYINQDVDWRKRNHFGCEFGLTPVTLQLGLSDQQVSYGVGLNLMLIKLQFTSYGMEEGTFVGQNPERIYLIRISFELPL